jgi:response regulator RpfG family c-di-GMP phosphodiesterase
MLRCACPSTYPEEVVATVFIIDASVLAVGLGNKSDALQELPIRLFVMGTGTQAVRCLRVEKIDTVISRWELPDMADGILLQKIRAAKPAIPTIAFIKPGYQKQEAAARSLGVSAVLDEDVDDAHFRRTVCELLGIYRVKGIKAVDGCSVRMDIVQKADSDI